MFDGDAEVASLGSEDQPGDAHVLVVGGPAAAVDVDKHRHRVRRQLLGPNDVQLEPALAAFAELDVAQEFDVVGDGYFGRLRGPGASECAHKEGEGDRQKATKGKHGLLPQHT